MGNLRTVPNIKFLLLSDFDLKAGMGETDRHKAMLNDAHFTRHRHNKCANLTHAYCICKSENMHCLDVVKILVMATTTVSIKYRYIYTHTCTNI